jgi:plastocyanin
MQHAVSVLACLCAFLAIGASATTGGESASYTVVIEGLKYEPETLRVKPGETVLWINKDPFPHTVTTQGVFDSHSIAASSSWLYTANITGKHAYTCSFHPNMKGTLHVE